LLFFAAGEKNICSLGGLMIAIEKSGSSAI